LKFLSGEIPPEILLLIYSKKWTESLQALHQVMFHESDVYRKADVKSATMVDTTGQNCAIYTPQSPFNRHLITFHIGDRSTILSFSELASWSITLVPPTNMW
jgi:hypothetical protein